MSPNTANQEPVCVACGRTGRLEPHHPIGRARVPSATVPLCRPCHDVQSERQREAGVDLEAKSSDPIEDLWAFAVGFQSLLSASGLGVVDRGADERTERAFIGLAREAVRTCSQTPGAAVGPDPIANATRDARRERGCRPRRGRATATPAPVTEAAAAAAVWSAIAALATTVEEMMGDMDSVGERIRSCNRLHRSRHPRRQLGFSN